MRLLLISAMLVGLGSATTAAQSVQDKAFYLASCIEQVSGQFGPEADIKLVNLRRAGTGMRVKVAVRLRASGDGMEKVQFTTCLVSRATSPGSNAAVGASPSPAPTRGAAGEEL